MRRGSFRQFSRTVGAGVAFTLVFAAIRPASQTQGGLGSQHWVGTWATALYATPPRQPGQGPQGQGQGRPPLPSQLRNQTLRQIVHTSLGGDRVRVVLSNAFGTEPLRIGGARIAAVEKGAAVRSGTDRALTFDGSASTIVRAGSTLVSDAVEWPVSPFSDLAVDLYLPDELAADTSPFTVHDVAQQTNYVSSSGNYLGTADLPVAAKTEAWLFLQRVEVAVPRTANAVVVIGDSITNGTQSTPDTNNRWSDHLARRLAAAGRRMAVLNVAIDGNRLLTSGNNGSMSALARFDRDVLDQPGATHVIVLEGVNDLRNQPTTTAEDIIAGYRQMVERTHARGLRIVGGTLTPAEGSRWTPEQEAKRRAINAWIRTSGLYDGVIDFDMAVRDPAQLSRIRPSFDSGGGLHPNDIGYAAMGAAVDLASFEAGFVR